MRFLLSSHFKGEQTEAQFKSSEWPVSGSGNMNTDMYGYKAMLLTTSLKMNPKFQWAHTSNQAILVLDIYYLEISRQEYLVRSIYLYLLKIA